MAAQRRYGRFVGTALVGGPLLVAGVVLASPAQAGETAFINDLHKAGIHDFDGGDAALLQLGYKLCNQLSWGASPGQLEALALQRSDATRGADGLTPQMADDLISDTLTDLCPNA